LENGKTQFGNDGLDGGEPDSNGNHSISLDKGLKVGEVGKWENSIWKWRLRWRRTRFEWESLQEEKMLRLISTGFLNKETQDRQLWEGDITRILISLPFPTSHNVPLLLIY